MGILYLLPRQHLVHKQLKPAILEPRQRMLDQLIPQFTLVVLIATPQAATGKGTPLANEGTDIRTLRHFRTAHEAQVDNDAVLRNSIEVLLEVRCADKVDDDVYAFAVCGLHDFLDPVLRRGV